MESDGALLRAYVRARSEEAFGELVARHLNLVHSAALRQLGWEEEMAKDATQKVFCELARKAAFLQGRESLGGWLYMTAGFVAARIWRTEARRTQRERKFAMEQESAAGPADWSAVAEVLDGAMRELGAADREAVILRFFKNESLGVVARELGATENAARMRVERALGKLRRILEARGVRCPAGALGALLAANAVGLAPVGLQAAVTASAATAAGTALPAWIYFMTTAQTKMTVAAIAMAAVTTGYVSLSVKNETLKADLAAARAEAVRPAPGLANSTHGEGVNAEELQRLRNQQMEVLRLRSEVTRLREAAAKHAESVAAARAKSAAEEQERAERSKKTYDEQMQEVAVARMGIAHAWGIAFVTHVKRNNGKFPRSFEEAAAHLPPDAGEGLKRQLLEWADQFEILFEGAIGQIERPGQTIVLRDKEPFDIRSDGSAKRTYLFADGHTEVHTAKDGNFEPWENRFLATAIRTQPTGAETR